MQYFAHDKINHYYNSISNITLDSYDIESNLASANAMADSDVEKVLLLRANAKTDDIDHGIYIQTMTLPDTNIKYALRLFQVIQFTLSTRIY